MTSFFDGIEGFAHMFSDDFVISSWDKVQYIGVWEPNNVFNDACR